MRFTIFICCYIITNTVASEPVYSLDRLSQHPYRYVPANGHASQNPGSPRHFAPGYGYRYSTGYLGYNNLPQNTDYNAWYSYGRRDNQLFDDATHRFWSNSYGGPWYHPGITFNTQRRWP